MDMVNIALLLIAVGIFAIIPIGCHMTRGHGPKGVTTPAH
jgi:hypothetical protein